MDLVSHTGSNLGRCGREAADCGGFAGGFAEESDPADEDNLLTLRNTPARLIMGLSIPKGLK